MLFSRTCHCEIFKKERLPEGLSVKKDIQKIYATDSDLPNATIKLYLKRAFFPITLSFGQKEKYYVHWVKYIAILFQMDQLK